MGEGGLIYPTLNIIKPAATSSCSGLVFCIKFLFVSGKQTEKTKLKKKRKTDDPTAAKSYFYVVCNWFLECYVNRRYRLPFYAGSNFALDRSIIF